MNFDSMIQAFYFNRDEKAIKNDFGKVLILGGCKSYPNAPLISSYFARISGVGFVSLGVPESIYSIVANKSVPTTIFEPSNIDSDFIYFDDKHFDKIIHSYSSILFGNGILDCVENERLLLKLLTSYEGNLIIDATGLSFLSKIELSAFKPKVLLTPHLGEAKKLLRFESHSRDSHDYVSKGKEYCLSHHCSILLKSYESILIDENGDEFDSSYSPTPSLAKAGSGDGLAGYIAGILAYGEKIESYVDCILFADMMIHKAAYLSQNKRSIGSSDILTTLDEIENVIKAKS